MNKTMIIGNLGNDPEIHYTKNSGAPVTTLSVATTERWKDGEALRRAWRVEREPEQLAHELYRIPVH